MIKAQDPCLVTIRKLYPKFSVMKRKVNILMKRGKEATNILGKPLITVTTPPIKDLDRLHLVGQNF